MTPSAASSAPADRPPRASTGRRVLAALEVVCAVVFVLLWAGFSLIWASWILGEGCFEVDDCGTSGLEKAVAVVQFLVALPGFLAGAVITFQRVRFVVTGRPSNVRPALKALGLSFLAWGLVLLVALWGPV